MRRRRHGSEDPEAEEVNLTPLLDIVFIMLIFFIVTASFVPATGMDVQRPTARTAAPKPSHTLVIGVAADATLTLDGRAVDLRGLRGQLERLRAERPGAGVLVAADREVPTGRLVAVMDQARLAGIEAIAVAAGEAGR